MLNLVKEVGCTLYNKETFNQNDCLFRNTFFRNISFLLRINLITI